MTEETRLGGKSIGVYALRLSAFYDVEVAFDMARFRAHLKEIRKGKIGRGKLAAKIGIAPSTIQNIEKGPDMPGIDTVAKIVEGIGVSLSEFFREIETGHVQTRNVGINPAVIGAIVDVGQGHPLPGLSKKTHEELAEWHWARAAEAAAVEQLGAKIRRAGRRKTGGG